MYYLEGGIGQGRPAHMACVNFRGAGGTHRRELGWKQEHPETGVTSTLI